MALSRGFDGVDDSIDVSISAIGAGASGWTFGGWVYANGPGEGNIGRVVSTGQQNFRLGASREMRASQVQSTTTAVLTTNETLDTATWYCVFCTWTAADNLLRVYRGTATSAMAELTYATQTAGVGSPSLTSTTFNIGNNAAGAATWDGRIGPVLICASVLTTTQMNAWRLGIYVEDANLRGYWYMGSRTASLVENQIGGANATVTGCTLEDGPPVGYCRHARTTHVPFMRTGRGAQVR